MNTSNIDIVLKNIIDRVKPALENLSDAESAIKPKPGKWSKKEILGHLIDSAANNHQRFVRAQLQNHLIFNGYEQEEWVIIQAYQTANWHDLLQLWHAYNNHLARVIYQIPDTIRLKKHREHNLDRIAFKTVPKGEPVTLEYFIHDYVGHLEHHIRQILPNYEPLVIGTY